MRLIESDAFDDCYSLTAFSVNPFSSYYGSYLGCLFNAGETNLIRYPIGNSETNFIIPIGTVRIEEKSFKGASKIEVLNIRSSVKSIGSYAFEDMKSLRKINFDGTVGPQCDATTFHNTNVKEISVPKNYLTNNKTFCGVAINSSMNMMIGFSLILFFFIF